MTASLLMLSSMAGVLVSPSPAGAADEVTVWVHSTYFQMENAPDPAKPNVVYAKPFQTIVFKLVDPSDRHHTVTIEPVDCAGRPRALCDKTFDDPNSKYEDRNNPTVIYSWSKENEYRFYDRYARDAGREMTGTFIVTHSPPTVQPSTTTSSTGPPTTPTTAAPTTTTTAPTTSTTAPTAVRPLLIPDPAPTTTTTVAANRTPPPTTAPAPKKDNKGKDKGKTKAASTETPTTATPAPTDAPALDFIFDPASLTPGPTLVPDNPSGSDRSDDAAIDASAAASLLDPQKSDDGGNRLMLIALGAMAVVMLVGGGWAWFNRASRYDPA